MTIRARFGSLFLWERVRVTGSTHRPLLVCPHLSPPSAGEGAERPRTVAVTILALAVAAAIATALRADDATPTPEESPVGIHAKTEPALITIGTRFKYTLEVTTTPDVEVVLTQPAAKIGDFDIVDFGEAPPAQRDGKTTITRWLTLVGYSPGDHLLKSPPVYYRRAGEELKEAPTNELAVSIESLLAKAGNVTEIRDIKGPEEFPIDWRPYYFVGGALAAVLALGFILYRVLNRSRRRALAPPPKPPHEIAFDDLQRLRRRGLIEQGAFKEFYSALSDIVRTYVEHRFGVRAPEMTTEEFLFSSARGGRLQSAHRSLLADFLTESDLVKFARHVPTIANSERAFAAAKRFVDETAPGLMSPPEEEKIRAVG